MPSFSYFSTFDESIKILSDLCDQGFRIIVEPGPFDEPKAPSFNQVDSDMAAILKSAPSFYLAGNFTRFPTQFFHLKSGSFVGKYVIDLQSQGPFLKSIVGRINVVNGMSRLLPGDISYQSEYKNPETKEWEKASSELKEAYRKAVSIIKNRCVPHNLGTKIFIGPEALKLLESGEVQINDSQINPPKSV